MNIKKNQEKMMTLKNINEIKLHSIYLETLVNEIAEINAKIDSLEKEKQEALEEFIEIKKEVKIFKKLETKHLEEYKEFIEKKEENEINDLVCSRYFVKANPVYL